MPTYDLKWINSVQLPEFQAWTDEFGMTLDNDKGDVGGNGNLFTAHYVTGLVQNKLLGDNEKARLLKVYENNFRFPGVLMRAPSKPDDRNAHDDVVGLLSADAQMNPDPKDRKLARAVYEHGKTPCTGIDETDQEKLATNKLVYMLLSKLFLGKVCWTWNNIAKDKFHVSSWLQRRMEVMATMQMCLREPVNVVYWLYWAAIMYGWARAAKDNEENDDILRFHMAMACEGYGPLTDFICMKVREKIAKDGGIGTILGEYFEKPNHPLVGLLKDIK